MKKIKLILKQLKKIDFIIAGAVLLVFYVVLIPAGTIIYRLITLGKRKNKKSFWQKPETKNLYQFDSTY